MSESIVTVRAVVRNGSIVDLQIRQEQPAAVAAVFWPAPRRVDGVLHLIRSVLRMERQRTVEAVHA
jgi:hypothetical protein